MDRLSAMSTFLRVVETGNFSAVARETGNTQSAISKQIAALERHLAVSLLTRTTRAVVLTDAGQAFYSRIKPLLGDLYDAEATTRNGDSQLSGDLRVAASVGFGVRIILPLVNQFLLAHPAIRIDLRLNDHFIDLVEQGIDVALRIGHLADSSLVSRQLTISRRGLIASRAYLERMGPPTTAQDLLRHNCIVYTERSERQHWRIPSHEGNSEAVTVQGNLTTNSSEVVRAATLAGMGISHAPTWLFRGELDSGDVQTVLNDHPMEKLPIHAIFPQGRRHSARVDAFVTHVQAAFGIEI